MNIINLTPPNTVRLTAEETQLLDLWHTCGLGVVLEKAHGIDPILLYLQQAPVSTEPSRLASNLSGPYHRIIKRGLWRSALNQLPLGDAQSFIWVFRNIPYETLLRLIKVTLSGQYTGPKYQPSVYGPKHPTFAKHEAAWAKHCTLLALEGFPLHVGHRSNRATEWLSSYESLECRFAGAPILVRMRKSVLRLANRGHHDLFEALGKTAMKVKPKTAGARKYMSLKGFDRLSMMRHHAYRSKDAD